MWDSDEQRTKIGSRLYHELLRTPGSSPSEAISRNVIRLRPNLRMYARGRPVTAQRFLILVGELLRGSA